MVRLAATWVALVAWTLVTPTRASGAPASDPSYRLSADTLEFESDSQVYVARGSVRIARGSRILRADWVSYSRVTGRGVASGNVELRDGRDVIRAEFIEFDIRSLTGVLFGARLDAEDSHFRAEGAEMRKTGDDTYSFEDGMFTTCQCPDGERDPWRIRAGKADLEVGGYATVRNMTFEILEVPVFLLPWMIYPFRTERQTGFLIPEVGYAGRDGVHVGVPFFWAAAQGLNVIVNPQWIQTRGGKADLQLEYVYGERSRGELTGSFILDDSIRSRDPETPFDEKRWAFTGSQDVFLPWGWRARADFRFVSDNDYVLDFAPLASYRNDRFLESHAFVGKSMGEAGRLGLVASVHTADDQSSPDDVDRDKTLMQRLPEVALSVLPAPHPWTSHLVPSLDAQYIYFRPRNPASNPDGFLDTGIDGIFDAGERDPATGAFGGVSDDFHADNGPSGTEGNGIFNEGEPLADRGSRVRITPRLAMPWRLGDVVEFYPEVAWYQTLYSSDARGFEERGLLTARADLRIRLRRGFGSSWVHIVEPRLGYAFVSQRSQRGNPLFAPPTAVPQDRLRQLDLDSVVRDSADRVARFSGMTLGLGNRIFTRPVDGRAPRLLADFSVSAGYGFRDRRFENLYLDGRTYAWRGTGARFSLGVDPEEVKIDEGLAELAWRSAAGHGLELGYRWLRDIPAYFERFPFGERFESGDRFESINQLTLGLRIELTERWSFTYRGGYEFERNSLLGNRAGIEFLSACRCWAIQVQAIGNPASGIQGALRVRLLGFGDDATPFGSLTGLGLLDDPGSV